jgi:hypothetical protein
MENSIDLFEMKGFDSFDEFDRFKKYLDLLVDQGILTHILRGKLPILVASFTEEESLWFADAGGNTWVLLEPDYPFKGFFKKFQDIT